MNEALLAALVLAGLALAGCDDKKTDPGAQASASAAASAAPSATPSASVAATVSAAPTVTAPPADPNAIPNQSEGAQKAATEIDKANYKSELDKLDKEIGK